ncbi:MAG: hypothetical protein K2X31_05415 [Sphingopyxis sp.]|nr:hypothetical protein [Sphingopyxis sp.]
MRFFNQRWRYQIGNNEIIVDNAFTWTKWGQERFILNGITQKEAGGWFVFKRVWQEPWLTLLEDEKLSIEIRSGLWTVNCLVTLGDEEVEPVDYSEWRWSGKKLSWPDERGLP